MSSSRFHDTPFYFCLKLWKTKLPRASIGRNREVFETDYIFLNIITTHAVFNEKYLENNVKILSSLYKNFSFVEIPRIFIEF